VEKPHHQSTTNPDVIYDWAVQTTTRHRLIFTTYNSLNRIQESGIDVDTIYFDEAHNSVQRHFFFLQRNTLLLMQGVATSSLQLRKTFDCTPWLNLE
jgi:DNA polymerase/3'-5' exonuclease PolX